MPISGCEILASKLLLHSLASERKKALQLFFKRIFLFCKYSHLTEGEEAVLDEADEH